MSERLTRCPKCQSKDVETVELLNPETHDMNCDAKLLCKAEGCGHEWQGKVSSLYWKHQREMGWIL